MNEADVAAFARCIVSGGVAVFPADTVYGLGCGAEQRRAIERLYRLKGRVADKPAAVMFFALEDALAALPELGERTVAAVRRLLPGELTLLVPNPAARFPLACGPDPGTLGFRVPRLDEALAPLGAVRTPLLQSSANRAGEPDARRLADVPEPIRAGADVVLDAGERPGTPSTVVDLRAYEHGEWAVVRAGAFPSAALRNVLQ